MIHPTSLLATAVNLNPPGRYLHWSIFTVSVANLVLVAVMVVIFGLALLVPFPSRRHSEDEPVGIPAGGTAPEPAVPAPAPDDAESKMWKIGRASCRERV